RSFYFFDNTRRGNGVSRLDRRFPARFQPAMGTALRQGPVSHHFCDQTEVGHSVHDDAAEVRLAEIRLHVLIVPVQWVVVEGGLAEFPDGFPGGTERSAFNTLAFLKRKLVFHSGILTS